MNIYCIQNQTNIWTLNWDLNSVLTNGHPDVVLLSPGWQMGFVSVIRKLLTIGGVTPPLLWCCSLGTDQAHQLTFHWLLRYALAPLPYKYFWPVLDPLITTVSLAWGGINQKRCRGVFNNNKDGCRCVNWSRRVGVEPGQTNDRDERERTETWYQVASFLLKSCSLELIGSQTTHHYSTLSSRTNSSLPPPILNTWST